MKPARWYRNVVFRTLRAFLPTLARPDDAFALRHLRGPEIGLYRAMDPRDRDHAVRVARGVLRRDPEADAVLLRAALLHDVGKSEAPYRAWERIAVHLYTPAAPATGTGARAPDAAPVPGGGSGIRAAWRRHRDHARRGAAMIRAVGGDPSVADLVERHHRPDGDPGLELLARVDAET